MKYYIGIDLGGTNIAVGVVDENYNIVGRAKLKTNIPRPAEEVCADMAKASRMAVEDAGLTMDDIEWVGVDTPGTVDTETGMLIYANNLFFHNVPMGPYLSEALGKPVFIENDANAAAYGEALAGGAKGKQDVIVITLGTGVGGGVIIDGKIYAGFNHGGAELGHMAIVKGGRQCTCGRKGCFETYSSATGLINTTKKYMEKYKDSLMWKLCGGDLDKVSGRTAFQAMKQGDKAGKECVDEYIEYMAYGLASIVNIFQPEVVCIGGGISKEGETLLAPLRELIAKEDYCRTSKKRVSIVAATLGNDAGIIGAAFLGRLQ
ncbi:ROK family protein [Zongyangia hominis]|uniref:ROK family protein n=1 Tax=Zongyangia hominis TaxID=2763677 RepID=A0A926E7Y5_9FIRM|nr:ROK family protein [Zongyangia hominis]MBC8569525.1 ROK family protein [Zongyangia hominis]